MTIIDKSTESASPRVLVHKFLYQLRERRYNSSSSSSSSGGTLATSSSSSNISSGEEVKNPLEAFLAPNVQILHPLLLSEEQKRQATEAKAQPGDSLEGALRLLALQEQRTYFGSLEMGLLDDTQVVRHGYSHVPGLRGAVVQVFQLDSEGQHIVSIYIAKTMAPWKERWWSGGRKSWKSRRALRQAWWEETWGDEAPPLDERAAAEEIAFQQRLIETNLFLFF